MSHCRVACEHLEGARHDCAHVDARDALVPVAEAEADARVPPLAADARGREVDDWRRRWDHAFHSAMDRLTRDPFIAAGGAAA